MVMNDGEPGEQLSVADGAGTVSDQAEPEELSFELQLMPPAISPAIGLLGGAIFLLVSLVPLLLPAQGDTSNAGPVDLASILTFVASGVIGVAILVFAYRENRRSTPPPIRLGADRLSLPRSERSTRSVEIAYQDLTDLQISSLNRRQYLIISAGPRVYRYQSAAFHNLGQMSTCVEQVRARVRTRNGGVEQLQMLDAKVELANRVLQRKQTASAVLLAMLVAVFLAELHFGVVGPAQTVTNPTKLIAWGANVPLLVRQGEWYRLIAANFLHAGFFHAYLNIMALVMLGRILERLIGHSRLLLVYLGSGLVGAAASALFPRGLLSVGASTALFGLLGAYAMLGLRYRQSLPVMLRQTRRWWLLILGINGALPLLLPNIDIAAHAGGFVAGALIMLAVLPATRVYQEPRPAGMPVLACTVLLSGVYLAGLGIAVQHALSPPDYLDRSWVLELILEREQTPALILNNLAWQVVTDDGASDRELELAQTMAERAVAAEPENYHTLDTLATICHRRGDLQRALELQRQAEVIGKD